MLSLPYSAATRNPLCNGVSRRSFLQIGALGLGGLSLPQLLQAEQAGGRKRGAKSVIMIYLVGGPPHQDMWDMKPDAPAEIAGPMRPAPSNVLGMEFCDLLPRMNERADKLVVVRSIIDSQAEHDAHQCFTGRKSRQNAPTGGWPQFGSTVAKVQGAAEPGIPPYASLCYTTTHGPYNEPGPGFLGVGQGGFTALGDIRKNMTLHGVTPERLGDRRNLLGSFDRLRRDVDRNGLFDGMDEIGQQAFNILTSSKLASALDLSKEDPKTVERYGTGNDKVMIDANGAPRVPQSFLLARRLVEAGCRVVTVNYSKWDWHGGKNAEGRADNNIFLREKEDFPVFDNALACLLDDLKDRGLDRDTAVVVWGEFGRTPIISKQSGRDHWPNVNSCLLAGGSFRTGQIIGSTDKHAGEATSRPTKFGEIFATLYHHLGISPHATVNDLSGRPQYLVQDQAQPMRELI